MTSDVKITGLGFGRLPAFDAEWHGRPLAIRLDTSAVLKLQGNGPRETILKESTGRVGKAAQRILEMRSMAAHNDDLVVTLTALDLD
jgi:hypothetical protein